MPELPDVAVYIERLSALFSGQVLEQTRLKSPFLVRSFEPPLSAAKGERVTGFRRIGKRIVFELSNELFLVFHLMIAGRFHLKDKADKLAGKHVLLGLDFAEHTLALTEAGSKRRASLHVVRGEENLGEFSRGGLEVLGSSYAEFREALVRVSACGSRARALLGTRRSSSPALRALRARIRPGFPRRAPRASWRDACCRLRSAPACARQSPAPRARACPQACRLCLSGGSDRQSSSERREIARSTARTRCACRCGESR